MFTNAVKILLKHIVDRLVGDSAIESPVVLV